jgi:hypothetical protein
VGQVRERDGGHTDERYRIIRTSTKPRIYRKLTARSQHFQPPR